MASLITLSEAKAHLRVSQSTEDTLIQVYIDAAKDYISGFLNMSNYPHSPSIKAAALLIIGDLYENRQWTNTKQVYENPAVTRLLYPYRGSIGV